MEFATSYLEVDGLWREILIYTGDNPPTEKIISNKTSDTITNVYYTNGIYKQFDDGHTWYIVNSKETIIDNPQLVKQVAELESTVIGLLDTIAKGATANV